MYKNRLKNLFWFLVFGVIVAPPLFVFAGDSVSNVAVTIPNPLGQGNDTLFKFITLLLDTVFPIASLAAVFFMIYAGFKMVMAGGNEEKLSKAKSAFLWTVVGISLLLGAKVLSAVICGTIDQLGTAGLSCPRP